MYSLFLALFKECVARSDKPHVPHVFPGEFLQYYPQDVEEIPLARMPYMPVDAPNVAWVRMLFLSGFEPVVFWQSR